MLEAYDVGGVTLPRPFCVRRLGHFGFNSDDLPAALVFYRDLLGFRVSDVIDFAQFASAPAALEGLGDTRGYFLRHGTDHHSFVLFNRKVREALDTTGRFRAGVTVNQVTWQVGSLQEVVDAAEHLERRGVPMSRTGRDTPGSNWHTYFIDPDGHTIELYYGIEQIGWNGVSKPKPMYGRGFRTKPSLPQRPEAAEVAEAVRQGVDLNTGFADDCAEAFPFSVGGLNLPRPFVVTGIGPVRLFSDDLAAARRFYEDELGFTLTSTHEICGVEALFFRCASDHHALAVYGRALQAQLPVRQDTSSFSFGVRLASYEQLRLAAAFLERAGFRAVDLPAEISPGVRHCAFFADPDGHLVQLYFEMEQIGWDGQPRRPPILPATDPATWPPMVSPLPDTYRGEVFLGPWL